MVLSSWGRPVYIMVQFGIWTELGNISFLSFSLQIFLFQYIFNISILQLNKVTVVFWRLQRRTWRSSTRLAEELERRSAGLMVLLKT
jgi:hypothetical protein